MSAQELPSINGSRRAVEQLDGHTAVVDPVPGSPSPNGRQRPAVRTEQPDALLDAHAHIDEISLEVRGLTAGSVLAETTGLLKPSVGANTSLERVALTITGVDVRAPLEVRLDEVRAILDKALTLLVDHPEVLEILAKTVVGVVQERRKAVDGESAPVVDPVVDILVRAAGGPPPTKPSPPEPPAEPSPAEQPGDQPGQPAEEVARPVADQAGPGPEDLYADGLTPQPVPAAVEADGVLERAIRLLTLLDKGIEKGNLHKGNLDKGKTP